MSDDFKLDDDALAKPVAWQDFSNAAAQTSFDVIPKGTIARVRLNIRPGGYDDISKGWTGGIATKSKTSDSVYIACEFVVMEGPFAKRRIFSNIGLHSPKGPTWANMGREMIRAILDSHYGLSSKDQSPEANNKRRINGLGDLDGMEFCAKIGVTKNSKEEDTNEISNAVTAEQKGYIGSSATSFAPQGGVQQPAAQANRPAWAQ